MLRNVNTNRDLLTGSGNFPYALAFARTDPSSTGTARTTTSGDTGLGNGWSHNWSSKVQTQSDPYLGIGTDSSPAVSAATSIAVIYVMLDLMSVAPSAQNWTISSMVARWFTDQLTGKRGDRADAARYDRRVSSRFPTPTAAPASPSIRRPVRLPA